MSEYEKCFSFDIQSTNMLLELKIIPSQNPPALCVKVCSTDDNEYDVYWNWGLSSREFVNRIMQFCKHNNSKYNSIDDLMKDELFIQFIKKFTPVYHQQLDNKGKEIINKIINTDWGFSCRVKNGGLDGHRYFLTLYNNQYRRYETWCTIPPEWHELITLIGFVVDDIVKVENKYRAFYLPYGTVSTRQSIESIEIPSWMK